MKDAVETVRLVAFIFSPLQALNLIEYSQRFGRPVDVVVVGGVSALEPTSRTQIETVLSAANPREIIYRQWGLSPGRPVGARRAVASAAASLRARLLPGPYEFVVGEYRGAFSWAVLRRLGELVRAVIVVDDGTATLRIDRRHSVLRSKKVFLQKCKKLVFLTMGVRGAVPGPGLTFFTTYAIDDRVASNDRVVHNDYRMLSGELRRLPPDNESVYVIGGSPHLHEGEIDAENVELALALDLIRFAAAFTGKNVVYIAHRREQADKLDALRMEVTIVQPSVPFEVYPRVVEKRPRWIVGYYSSLFVTAAKLFGDSVEITALQIPLDRIDSSWHPFIDEIYDYYRTELQDAVRIVDWPPTFSGGLS